MEHVWFWIHNTFFVTFKLRYQQCKVYCWIVFFPKMVSLVLSVVKILSQRVFDLGVKWLSIVIFGTRENEHTWSRKSSVLDSFSNFNSFFMFFTWEYFTEIPKLIMIKFVYFYIWMPVNTTYNNVSFFDWLFQWILTADVCFNTSSSHSLFYNIKVLQYMFV